MVLHTVMERLRRHAPALPAATAAVVLVVLLTATIDDAAAQNRKGRPVHGAVAYDRANGAHGYAYDFPNERAAKSAALRECGHPGCEVLVAFRNGCGAVADGPVEKPAAGRGATIYEAEGKALKACGDPACRIVAWSCTK
jgi:hypothetical protein